MQFLSGGNQQKVIIARWLFSQARLLIMDEPTQGIDIGAKHEIYKVINELTANGISVLLDQLGFSGTAGDERSSGSGSGRSYPADHRGQSNVRVRTHQSPLQALALDAEAAS